MLARDDADPLARLCDVWFGCYPSGDHGDQLRDAYRSEAEEIQIVRDAIFPDIVSATSPASATGVGLVNTGDSPGSVVAIVGDDPDDLVQLWNARAAGGDVFAWPLGHTDRIEGAFRAWLASPGTLEAAAHFRSGDGKNAWRSISVLPGRQHTEAEVRTVLGAIEDQGWRSHLSTLDFGSGWIGPHPIQTDLDKSFSVSVERDDWHVVLQVPPLGIDRKRKPHWPGHVIADVVVHAEERLPPGRSLAVPAIRRLAPLLGKLRDEMSPMRRPTGNGRALAVQADADSLTVGLVPTFALFEELFGVPGWSIQQSDEGRFGTQLIERLGGPRAETASQPAVRAVLHQASNATRAHPIARLIESAISSRGDWPDLLSNLTPRQYGTRVVYWLIERGLLRPALQVRCPRCATETDMRPEDLASHLRCSLCDGDFALGIALATTSRKGSHWAYELAATVPPTRLRSALPVMAALGVISSHRAGSAPAIPHVLGLEVHTPSWDCELDIAAAVIDGTSTVVVVGEVKGGHDAIDANDLGNLERVRDGLRSVGVESIVVAATARESLSAEERADLRALCERAPQRISHGGSVSLNLPLVLVARDISMPWMNEEHPWHWGDLGQPALGGMAMESCRRNLGLADLDFQSTSDGWVQSPRWTD